MKKLILLLLAPVFTILAQEPEKPTTTTTTTTTTISTAVSTETAKPSIFTRKHEVRIGGIKLLAGPIIEGTYEYIYSKDFTFGSAVQFNASGKEYEENFSITPFARFYFQETQEYGAKGFFVEGFAKYYSGQYIPDWFWNNNDPAVSFSSVALGLSIGKKWINSSGFVVEIFGGAGRVLGSSENKPSLVGRGDISLGYRF